jgi:hypothetical protein
MQTLDPARVQLQNLLKNRHVFHRRSINCNLATKQLTLSCKYSFDTSIKATLTSAPCTTSANLASVSFLCDLLVDTLSISLSALHAPKAISCHGDARHSLRKRLHSLHQRSSQIPLIPLTPNPPPFQILGCFPA